MGDGTAGNARNVEAAKRLEIGMQRALAKAMRRGFYGEIRVVIKIEDGVIQRGGGT